jgi:formylglycine-generating enzyme
MDAAMPQSAFRRAALAGFGLTVSVHTTSCGGRVGLGDGADSVDGAPGSSDRAEGANQVGDSNDSPDSGSSSGGGTANPRSCVRAGDGLTNCGVSSESCCASLEVTGGTFYRTFDSVDSDGGVETGADGGSAGLGDPATISTFRLDKYEVTVGRFRQFRNAWDGGAGYAPPEGSGKHAHLNGGLGLANSGTPGTYEPGWSKSDDDEIILAPTPGLSNGCTVAPTWTDSPGNNERLPLNCVNWYEAYAFCIWDGAFLPSEAEWEYAAAGGSQQREYPWGTTPPGTASRFAICGDGAGACYYPADGPCVNPGLAPVGTPTLGQACRESSIWPETWPNGTSTWERTWTRSTSIGKTPTTWTPARIART